MDSLAFHFPFFRVLTDHRHFSPLLLNLLQCNGNYNVADIYRKAEGGKPEIVMPPLSVPESCKPHIVTRKDDTEEIILKRLKIYENESKPLEAFYRERALLLDYEITGGIEHTLPTLSPAVVRGLRS